MRVGVIGTGAISWKHAQAYKNIGYEVTVCTDINEASGKKFAGATGAEFVRTYEEVCRHPRVDYVDVCTFPDFRLEPIEICAKTGKHVQVQKPVATNLDTARRMIETARQGHIVLGVVSQHRFDDSCQFLKKAIADGRLGKIHGAHEQRVRGLEFVRHGKHVQGLAWVANRSPRPTSTAASDPASRLM